MSRVVRDAILDLLALLVLIGGALNTQWGVLCVGPGNHYHLEVVIGASCNDSVPASHGLAHPRDGCPSGSKDFRLAVDTHRGHNTGATEAPAALSVSIRLVEFTNPPHYPESFRLLPTPDVSRSTIVLLI